MAIVKEIVFLGTGTSEGTPIVSCLTNPKIETEGCKVCQDAYINPNSKNLRRNTGLLIKVETNSQNTEKARSERIILVDCGKFFWQSALQFFPKYNIRNIDSIVISHYHNDACFGIDDLRDFTKNTPGNGSIQMYVAPNDFKYIKGAFPYLIDSSQVTLGGGVSDLKWNIIHPNEDFVVEDLKMIPLEVMHGSIPCLGFFFSGIAWISDVTHIPDEVREKIVGKCDILVIDMLRILPVHPSHFVWHQSLDEVLRIKPRRAAYFVGMNHLVDHDTLNEKLRHWKMSLPEDQLDPNVIVELAYDGLCINNITNNNNNKS